MHGRNILGWLLSLALVTFAAPGAADGPAPGEPDGTFTALSYHEVRLDVREYPEPFSVDAASLVAQFARLRRNGYTPVSIDEIIAARQGGRPLPAKPILLCFDDAYQSFYNYAYPLLREFRFPAVLAVVGSWIDSPYGVAPRISENYAGGIDNFATWGELREMADSGFIELASHTYDLHHGIPANPQGNMQPAATARLFNKATGGYEDDAAWLARVGADLERNADKIQRETGHRPRTVVWPYGSYNDALVALAASAGSPVTLTLVNGPNSAETPLNALNRTLIENNPNLAEFAMEVRGPEYPEPHRVLRVDLDDVYSPDPQAQEGNLTKLLDRILTLKANQVFLQACVDQDGDGFVDSAYFPNRHVPVRADLFNRAAWQISTRTLAKVYAVMPVSGFRLSPEALGEVYSDLASHASFEGLLFDDSPLPGEPAGAASVELTRQLAARVRWYREPVATARSIFVGPGAPATSDTQFDRTLSEFLAAYDEVALTTMPGQAAPRGEEAEAWLSTLAARVAREHPQPEERRKIIFMLHSPDQGAETEAAGKGLARRMRMLQLGGSLGFGYFTDDIVYDHPPLARTAPAMSLRIYPARADR